MSNILYVGDPHTQINNLEESAKLMTFVHTTARISSVDKIVLLGDLFHTHALIRLEVQQFWNVWLAALAEVAEVLVLVGNHDMTGDHSLSGYSALSIFADRPNVRIISESFRDGPLGFLPYQHDKDKFLDQANSLHSYGAKTLICHQSFSGSMFENGYYDPNGINPDQVRCDQIISGHIHAKQEFGKVWHPGTAMWLTSSDANQEKGIWIVEHDNVDGKIKSKLFLDTSTVVTPIRSFQWKEGDEKPEIPTGIRATIELIGTSEWIAQKKLEVKGSGAIKSTITNSKMQVRKAHRSFEEYLDQEFDLVSTFNKAEFLEFLKEQKLVG